MAASSPLRKPPYILLAPLFGSRSFFSRPLYLPGLAIQPACEGHILPLQIARGNPDESSPSDVNSQDPPKVTGLWLCYQGLDNIWR
ncbi:hypothetical protein IQ06DRAFT_297273 [Phaeosphaeriaceae sp. SRC1lsM3a]|nr:hypothetical protein IQ06DRAFT_297273 [Stagonospora sp. SRC1lsM3a]